MSRLCYIRSGKIVDPREKKPEVIEARRILGLESLSELLPALKAHIDKLGEDEVHLS